MIIDCHTHIAYHKLYPDEYILGMLPPQVRLLPGCFKIVEAFMNDKDCSKLITQMDKAGINKSVLLMLDGGVGFNQEKISLEENYKIHRRVLDKYPDRFVVFGGTDPRRGQEAFELFSKSILDWGFKGLKLYPPMGYAMNDPGLNKYYELCNERCLPVLIHTGPSLPSMKNHYADIKHIRTIASTYPKISFIMAHAGNNITEELISILEEFPNVYIDFSGFQILYSKSRAKSEQYLSNFFGTRLYEKSLFGSDWPLFHFTNSIKSNIDWIKVISDRFPKEKTEYFFRVNIEAILNANSH